MWYASSNSSFSDNGRISPPPQRQRFLSSRYNHISSLSKRSIKVPSSGNTSTNSSSDTKDDSDASSSASSDGDSGITHGSSSETDESMEASDKSTDQNPKPKSSRLTEVAIAAGLVLLITILVVVFSVKNYTTSPSNSPVTPTLGAASSPSVLTNSVSLGSSTGLTPSTTSTSTSPGTTLADGSKMITGGIAANYSFQASGILVQGNCPSNVNIADCYHLHLDATGMNDPLNTNTRRRVGETGLLERSQEGEFGTHLLTELEKRDRTPRQRIEFLGGKGKAGDSRTYSWSSFLVSGFTSGDGWFHNAQIKNDDVDPLITATIRGEDVTIMNYQRPCNTSTTSAVCASIPLTSYWGITLRHVMKVLYGTDGHVEYTISELATGNVLLSYAQEGAFANGYNKHGMYRESATVRSAVDCYIGDYNVTAVADFT